MTIVTAKDARKLVEQATQHVADNIAAMEKAQQEVANGAKIAAVNFYYHASQAIEKAAKNGEHFAIVDQKIGYDRGLDEFKPANAVFGEPQKNRHARKTPNFPITMMWHHLAKMLSTDLPTDERFEMSFEKSATGIDSHFDQDIYMLVAYWD